MVLSFFLCNSLGNTAALESLPALSPFRGLANYFIIGSKGAQEKHQKTCIGQAYL